ncbi:MAG: UxaA family hydrolase [Chloroflexi bacterium]|nr:UxaA family hydrolase [Chloroflexota bacterium]
MSKCFQINKDDNTAVLLADAVAGTIVEIVGGSTSLTLHDDIEYGHKVALQAIPSHHPIIKYGICIGHSTQPIRAGEWIHLHNCASEYDARSATLDIHTGATTDTVYE